MANWTSPSVLREAPLNLVSGWWLSPSKPCQDMKTRTALFQKPFPFPLGGTILHDLRLARVSHKFGCSASKKCQILFTEKSLHYPKHGQVASNDFSNGGCEEKQGCGQRVHPSPRIDKLPMLGKMPHPICPLRLSSLTMRHLPT